MRGNHFRILIVILAAIGMFGLCEPVLAAYTCGDANDDGGVNVGDAVYLINYVFKGGPEPPPNCCGDCPGGLVDCGGQCVDINSDENNCGSCNTPCPAGYICQSGSCVLNCPPGQVNCGGNCVNLQSDEGHCGACGTACPQGTICQNGVCVLNCPPGQVECSGQCVDILSDENNCGSCNTVCPQGTYCVNGSCVSKASQNPDEGSLESTETPTNPWEPYLY